MGIISMGSLPSGGPMSLGVPENPIDNMVIQSPLAINHHHFRLTNHSPVEVSAARLNSQRTLDRGEDSPRSPGNHVF